MHGRSECVRPSGQESASRRGRRTWFRPAERLTPFCRGCEEDVVRRESNNPQMNTVTPHFAEAELPASRRYDLNWGLIGALGVCMLFWAAATFGLILVL